MRPSVGGCRIGRGNRVVHDWVTPPEELILQDEIRRRTTEPTRPALPPPDDLVVTRGEYRFGCVVVPVFRCERHATYVGKLILRQPVYGDQMKTHASDTMWIVLPPIISSQSRSVKQSTTFAYSLFCHRAG
jgi:hypothetical protein